jgi:hypothetical protein
VLLDWLGGFVAAEGTFVRHERDSQVRHTLAVHLGAQDHRTCRLLAEVLGCGTVHRYGRRKPHYDDEVRFQVRREVDLVEKVVPFLDDHLPPSHKRRQYEVWRASMLAHWDQHARRRRPCTVAGCSEPQRAKGCCRSHYYERYGR